MVGIIKYLLISATVICQVTPGENYSLLCPFICRLNAILSPYFYPGICCLARRSVEN